MSVRTAYPATESAGQTLTAANFDKLPGGWIGRVSTSTSQGSITSLVDLTSMTLTVTANSSRCLLILGQVAIQTTSAADHATVFLLQNGSEIARAQYTFGYSGGSGQESRNIMAFTTPSSGSNTYKLQVQRTAGSGTLTAGGTNDPSWLAVLDVGPA